MKKTWICLWIGILILSACSTATESDGSPATTDLPSATLAPSATAELTATPVPENPQLFLDIFDDGLDPAWSWINEDPERWEITTDGWLSIQANHPGLLANEGDIRQVNLLVTQAPEGDFTLTTRIYAQPDENFQQAGIFLIHDGQNYAAALNAYCEVCLPEGLGFYMEGYVGGEYVTPGMAIPHTPEQYVAYLRLDYSAATNSVSGYYALQPDQWQLIGTVDNLPPVQQIGLGAANAPGPGGVQEDLQANFDYVMVHRQLVPVQAYAQVPEPTPIPTLTPTPTLTPLPPGVLFRDDFEGYLQPGWSWVNEEADRWTFTEDGWLEIQAGNQAFYFEEDYGLVNFLTRELPTGEFMITAHIRANPTEDFQQAAIYIFEDARNYIALNIGFCSICGVGGPGFFMETFIDNNPGEDAYQMRRDPAATDVYLRLVNQGGSLIGYYATSPGEWQRIGAFGNYFDFKLVGLGTTNSKPGGVEQDLIAQFDFFEISLPD